MAIHYKLHPDFVETFVKSLKAEDTEKYKICTDYFERFKKSLMSKANFKVNRIVRCGSMGKSTALYYGFDMDIVVCIEASSYSSYSLRKSDYIRQIETVMKEEFSGESITKLECNSNSFRTEVNGIEIDILPALTSPRVSGNASEIAHRQHNFIVQQMHSGSRKPFLLSFELCSSMAEYGDYFVNSQSKFIKQLIILVKHWCKCNVGDQVDFFGKMSTTELLAIHVGMNFEAQNNLNHLEAFQSFLKLFTGFNSLAIEFSNEPPNKRLFNSFQIRRIRPYILDPVNPYNNRIHSTNVMERRLLENIGKNSFNEYMKCFESESRESIITKLDKFFQFKQHMGAAYDASKILDN